MDIKKTIEYIIRDLKETRDIIDDFKNYHDVPVLQIEMAKSKCKSAEEMMILLKDSEELKPGLTDNQTTFKEPELVEDKVEELIEIDIIETSHDIVSEIMQPVATNQPVKTILSDKFRDNTSNINDQIGNIKGDSDINSKLRGKPITNLADVIGLNDKFFYIREIFSGDHKNYQEVINKLNNVKDLNDAKAVIMSYTGQIEDNEALLQLIEIVKRKISINE